jgi:hypothetical protein
VPNKKLRALNSKGYTPSYALHEALSRVDEVKAIAICTLDHEGNLVSSVIGQARDVALFSTSLSRLSLDILSEPADEIPSQ